MCTTNKWENFVMSKLKDVTIDFVKVSINFNLFSYNAAT